MLYALTSLFLLAVCDADPLFREIRSTACDTAFSNLSSTHTMCKTDIGSEIAVSEQDRQAILDKHNNYRKNVNPPATNLFKLIWDANVAAIAAKLARQCTTSHDEYEERQVPQLPGVDIGQNIGAGYDSLIDAIENWHSEVDDFEYGLGNKTMKAVGHYTQVVGFRAVRIGCGQASCTGAEYPKYQVCNYAAAQYTQDLKLPYTNGTSCSDCPTGKCSGKLCDCEGKLCLNGGILNHKTCTCSCQGYFIGDICDEVNCPANPTADVCTMVTPTDKSWCVYSNVQRDCAALCGLCTPTGR